jgi:lysozyme family protein
MSAGHISLYLNHLAKAEASAGSSLRARESNTPDNRRKENGPIVSWLQVASFQAFTNSSRTSRQRPGLRTGARLFRCSGIAQDNGLGFHGLRTMVTDSISYNQYYKRNKEAFQRIHLR